MFNKEELKNILALINIAPIKGGEATTVAILQQKIVGLLTPQPEPVIAEKTSDETGETK